MIAYLIVTIFRFVEMDTVKIDRCGCTQLFPILSLLNIPESRFCALEEVINRSTFGSALMTYTQSRPFSGTSL